MFAISKINFRQNQKQTRKTDNSPLKMNLNLCAERLKSRNKTIENNIVEEDKIPNKLTKKM